MKAKDTLDLLIGIINEPNESIFGEKTDIYHFKYSRNIKTDADIESGKLQSNPGITLQGTEKINRYNRTFEEFYDEMLIKKMKLSLYSFRDLVQQLFFENKITINEIVEEVTKIEIKKVINMAKIYGVKLDKGSIRFGKYLLVSKNEILEYIEGNIDQSKNEFFYDKQVKEMYIKEATSFQEFAYCICEYEVRDTRFADDLFTNDKNRFINILRYMIGLKHRRVYVDLIKFIDYRTEKTQIASGVLLHGMQIERKDISIDLSDPFFNSKENANYFVWEISKKDNLTQLDKRILRAIDWIGLSVNEGNNDVACTEIAFAFESLLKMNESLSPITSSIQGQIAETVAFLVGNDLVQRMNLINQFKDFYSFRSAVTHGGETSKTGNYYEYLALFKNTIKSLLTDKRFINCKTIDQVNEKIKEIKFSN